MALPLTWGAHIAANEQHALNIYPYLTAFITYTPGTIATPTVTSTVEVTLPAVTLPPVTLPPVTSTVKETYYTGQATITPAATDLAGIVTLDDTQYTSILAGLGAVVLCVTAIVVISMRRGGRH